MAHSWSLPSPISLLQSKKSSSFLMPFIPKSLIPITIFPNTSLSLSSNSISKCQNLCFTSLVSICCSTSSESSTASDHSQSTSVFVKGIFHSIYNLMVPLFVYFNGEILYLGSTQFPFSLKVKQYHPLYVLQLS